MSQIIANGYLGLTAPDLDEWRTFATEVAGAQVAATSTDERLHLRIDERAWRVAVEPGPAGLGYLGFEVANGTALEELAQHLQQHGVAVREDPDLAATRLVSGLLVGEDPAGNQVEFFYGAQVAEDAFVSPTGARFVTSHRGPGDMGYGHCDLLVADGDAAMRFYRDILGFKVSDTMAVLPGAPLVTFMHMNARHHSFALTEWAGAPPLGHFMFEMEELDMVGRAFDRATDLELDLTMTVGKHTNDHMVSFYIRTPSGAELEVGTGGRRIDDDAWLVSHYDSPSYWGHRNPKDIRKRPWEE